MKMNMIKVTNINTNETVHLVTPDFNRYIVDVGIVTQEEADSLRLAVSFNHLFCDKDFYESVKAAVGNQLIKEIYG